MPDKGRPPPELVLSYWRSVREALRAAGQSDDVPKVGLTEVEEHGYSIDEQIALHHAALRQQDANLRKHVAYWIIGTFIGANLVTLIALGLLAWLDQNNIASKLIAPADRIISNQVFMSLLGATTVQVGAIMVIIARYLFPGRPS